MEENRDDAIALGRVELLAIRVRLLQTSAAEAIEVRRQLDRLGYALESEPLTADALRALRHDPPAAAVINLSRAPAAGRDLALNLHAVMATRAVRLVFVGGTGEKLAQIQALLPDAVFTAWEGIAEALQHALIAPEPAAPVSVFAGYYGTPLVKKLGIRPGMRVGCRGEPDGVRAAVGDLPEGALWTEGPGAQADLLLWFVRSRQELETEIGSIKGQMGKAGVWILWPKKGSPLAADLNERCVRETGLAHGLVDYKIAAVDETWSGLKFARRKA